MSEAAVQERSALVEKVDAIIAHYEAKPTALIMILQEVQNEFLHVPVEAMRRICERMDLAMSQIYGVVTFYKAFSLTPRGRHHVCVCTGTACHVRNSASILEKLERDLKVERGCTSPDGEFTLETVNCVGACALGPVVIADEKYYGNLTVGDVEEVIRKIKAGKVRGGAAAGDTGTRSEAREAGTGSRLKKAEAGREAGRAE